MRARSLALASDLYELTMAAAYFANRVTATASFELFVRDLPATRNYLVAAGLEHALDYIENFHFTDEDIAYLRAHPVFEDTPPEFFSYLATCRFTGEVWAVPEGTPVFENEPLIRVTAPILEAQIVETFLLATVNFQTMIASKASRVVHAAGGREVIEFGSRRAHGTEAAMNAARAAYVAGCAGTSNVEAGLHFGVPTSGTIAHSWVMAFDDEVAAFDYYTRVFPHSAVLLTDTYDTVEATRKIVCAGLRPRAVRLDSGDLDRLSREVRRVLDEGDLHDTRIVASGDLDEWRIAALVAAGAPVDAFGVGTRLATSFDAPALGGVYKLVEIETAAGRWGKVKTSTGKATYPGRKQVWRQHDSAGVYVGDIVCGADEPPPPGAEPLLNCEMRGGHRLRRPPTLAEVRQRCRARVERLPPGLKALGRAPAYPVQFSAQLRSARNLLAGLDLG
ncbi:MAG: nicotinate phosphoribosyltransferase [Candidatus Binatia bacterium]